MLRVHAWRRMLGLVFDAAQATATLMALLHYLDTHPHARLAAADRELLNCVFKVLVACARPAPELCSAPASACAAPRRVAVRVSAGGVKLLLQPEAGL